MIASFLHLVNGPVFAGEGVLLGLGCFRDLMIITATGIGTMVACLTATSLGQRLNGILFSFFALNTILMVALVTHYLKIGPLAVRNNATS